MRETVGVSRETELVHFLDLVRRWNSTINLVSPGDLAQLEHRHLADSLQLVGLMPPSTTSAIDLGSGGGFPGLVLSLATGVQFDLVESDRRKAVFLREAIRTLGAPARVHASRAEAVQLPATSLVTARALAPLTKLLTWSYRLLAPGGMALFPKGATAASEIDEARRRWTMSIRCIPSQTHPQAVILQITDLRPNS